MAALQLLERRKKYLPKKCYKMFSGYIRALLPTRKQGKHISPFCPVLLLHQKKNSRYTNKIVENEERNGKDDKSIPFLFVVYISDDGSCFSQLWREFRWR